MTGLLGPMQGQGMGGNFQKLLQPEYALPIAGALMSGNGNRDSFGRGLQMAGYSAQQMREDDRAANQRNATVEYLRSIDPGLASAVEAGMPAGQAFSMHAQKQRMAQAQTPSYGLTPQVVMDADGNTKMMQLGTDGSAREVQMPEGYSLADPVQKVDVGTHIEFRDRRTGALINRIAKENYQEAADTARGTVEGKAAGEANVGLSSALAKTEATISLIDDMLVHPGRATATGASRRIDPRNFIPGTDAYDFAVRDDQLRGKVFMEAYQTLKGGGQITEIEGRKAEEAIARLNRSQSDEEYVKALRELQTELRNLAQLAQRRAGKPNQITVTPNSGSRTWSPERGLE